MAGGHDLWGDLCGGFLNRRGTREWRNMSSDYDPTDKTTQMFFAETQNKLLYAECDVRRKASEAELADRQDV